MKQNSTGIPLSFLAAVAVAGVFMACTAADHYHWWKTLPDYIFGYIVPCFVAFVVYDRWARVRAQVLRGGVPGPAVRWQAAFLQVAAYGGLAFGALCFIYGAMVRANQGANPLASFSLAAGTAAVSLSLVYLFLPEGPRAAAGPGEAPDGSGWLDNPRVRTTALFLFPALIWLISTPLPSQAQQQLELFLLNKVTDVVFGVFSFMGLPLEQHRNVLFLPDGSSVGVEEACSGIRSLTACIFAGSFLAAVFLDKGWKKLALVLTAMVMAVVMNLGRSLFLTGWAYSHGAASIDGAVHDIAGYAVLGVTCGALLVLVWFFNLKVRFGAGSAAASAGEK